jgi:outer membrane protein TolC
MIMAGLAWSPCLEAQYGSLAAGTVPQATGEADQTQSIYFGSMPVGKATAGVMDLSLKDAIERGLKYNLAILLGDQETRSARGVRWKALSSLLPDVTAQASESIQQINLHAFGFPGFPGIRPIVGPFSVFDSAVS